ncbi:DEAD/DEAH box helicase [Gracilimonas halophila]|uniref:DEAD/DEAH box helicase n=1 Tax=Gracilimonas halophila TaxID=1834464 RepID=A0ABW5JGA3_9BACT
MANITHDITENLLVEFSQEELKFTFSSFANEKLKALDLDLLDDKTVEVYLSLNKQLADLGYVRQSNTDNAYYIKTDDFYDLDWFDRTDLIHIDNRLKGIISIKPKGLNAADPNFRIQVVFKPDSSPMQRPFSPFGPILKAGLNHYHLTDEEYNAFSSYLSYIGKSTYNENDHYQIVALFKKAKSDRLEIDESRFKHLKLSEPKKVSLNITKENNGDLSISPNLAGVDSKNLHALEREFSLLNEVDNNRNTLHVDDELIMLDEKKNRAVKEVLKKGKIPKKDVNDFLNNPGSFFNGDLIDLDTGFSYRVKGLVEYTKISFTDLDGEDNDWFLRADPPLIEDIEKVIHDETDLNDFKKESDLAYEVNSSSMVFNRAKVKLPDEKIVLEEELEQIRSKINEGTYKQDSESKAEKEPEKKRLTFDIDFYDQNKAVRDKFKEAHVPEDTYQSLKYKPKSYQYEGIDWIYSLYKASLESNKDIQGGILADDMGLGKTFTTLVAMKAIIAHSNKNNNPPKPFLVIAPLSLLKNWESEIEKFFISTPFHDVKILNGQEDLDEFRLRSGNERLQVQDEDQDMNPDSISYCLKIGKKFGTERLDVPRRVVLTTYSGLRNYQFSLARIDWAAVMFDEAQNIKNPDALQTRSAKALNADLKLLITGTPVENKLEEYWCLMDTANPKLFGSRKFFIKEYVDPIKDSGDPQVQIEVGRKLYKDSGQFLLRRLKSDVLDELPNKYYYKGIEQEDITYSEHLDQPLTDDQITKIEEIRKIYAESDSGNIALSCLSKTRNCYLHPLMTFDSSGEKLDGIDARLFWGNSARLKALYTTITDVKSKHEKLIIFVISKAMQKKLRNRLIKDFGVLPDIISGDTKVKSSDYTETRMGIIDEFTRSKGFQVIILSPIAAGVGLNITAANHVFHLDRHWNPAKEEQANDRVYRIGQEKDVHIYYPISKLPGADSFDIKLDNMLSRKLFLKDAIMTLPQGSERDLAVSTMSD